jgi:hypothetical protein
MFKPAGSKIVDKNKSLIADRAMQLELQLKLQRRMEPFSAAQFKEKQLDLYSNLLNVTNTESLGSLIANEKISTLQNDPLQSYLLAKDNLMSISDLDTSNYIIDRLNESDIQTLNQGFPNFIRILSTKYKNIDKNKFIELIKANSFEFQTRDVTQTAKNRMNQDLPSEKIEEPYQESETKNPSRNTKSSKTVYGNILNESLPQPITVLEQEALESATNYVSSLKTVRDLNSYIKTIINSKGTSSLRKSDLQNVALKLRYREELMTEGRGLNKRRIVGRGMIQSEPDNRVELNNGKFVINMDELGRNVLNVKYASSRASIPSMKREGISNDVKNVIVDIVKGKYNPIKFNKMKSDDQRIVSTFVRNMKIPNIDMSEWEEAYQRNYEVLLGQLNSGQNNPAVKRELKQYIMRAITEGIISRNQGYNQLFELSL